MKTWHWAVVAATLTVIWLGFMIWMSYLSYRDNDPRPMTPAERAASEQPAGHS